MAATAVAFVNDKAEHRPGTPHSSVSSAEGAPRQSYRKKRFHPTQDDGLAGLDEEAADEPGARSKMAYGTLPMAKHSSTHDSESKGPRFVQEPPEYFTRRQTPCVYPDAMEDEYEEIPSPLPSPRDDY